MPRLPRSGSDEPDNQDTTAEPGVTETSEDTAAQARQEEAVTAQEPAPAAEPERQNTIRTPVEQISDSRDDTESQSRVSVVNESVPATDRSDDDEYKWHTGLNRPHGQEDAVEFIDVHKAFGSNKILRGLNLGLPEGKISMILGPSGTGKSVCIKHMVGLLYPDDGDVLVHGESVPNMQDDDLFEMRKKFGVLFQDGALFGSMNVLDNT